MHVGIDIGGPVGTPCMAFMDGEISHFGYNPQPGDYGNVVITKHKIGNQYFWALYGHLDSNSIKNKTERGWIYTLCEDCKFERTEFLNYHHIKYLLEIFYHFKHHIIVYYYIMVLELVKHVVLLVLQKK